MNEKDHLRRAKENARDILALLRDYQPEEDGVRFARDQVFANWYDMGEAFTDVPGLIDSLQELRSISIRRADATEREMQYEKLAKGGN